MTDSQPVLDRFHDLSVVGAGVIGSSWAALLLAHGVRVTVTDVRGEAEAELRATIDELSPTLRALGLPAERLTDRLVFEPDLATAVRGASLVQENGPEVFELKQQLLVDIERAAPPGVLICSSSSAILATYATAKMQDPSRRSPTSRCARSSASRTSSPTSRCHPRPWSATTSPIPPRRREPSIGRHRRRHARAPDRADARHTGRRGARVRHLRRAANSGGRVRRGRVA